MNKNQSWDDLGRRIQYEVDRAVNSQDFQNMANNIRHVLENAADAGGEVLRRAADAIQTPRINVRDLYGKTGGKVVGGLLKSFFGGVFTLGLTVGAVAGLFSGGIVGALVPGALLAGSGWMLSSGVGTMKTVSRFRTYRKLLGKKTSCALDRLARAVGRDVPFVRKDVQKMIGSGYFLEGHLDHEQNHLITSDATYQQFEQARLQLEQARKQQAAAAAAAPDPRIREVLDRGNSFIAQIRKCNDDIPGEAVSGKIDRIEQVVVNLLDNAVKFTPRGDRAGGAQDLRSGEDPPGGDPGPEKADGLLPAHDRQAPDGLRGHGRAAGPGRAYPVLQAGDRGHPRHVDRRLRKAPG